MLITLTLFVYNVSAQEKLYLLFEFMTVDNNQEAAYMDTEEFWQNIHEKRVNNGEIIGWDLWRLQPGGEDQPYQYLTVNLYNDPVKMMTGGEGDFSETLKEAYPDTSANVLEKILNRTGGSRDLSVRFFAEYIDGTIPEYDIPIGTVASIDLMKVELGNYSNYEKAEREVFKPMHQKQVDNGEKESWGLVKIIIPVGSATAASHITVNMYKDYAQFFSNQANSSRSYSDKEQKAIRNGLATRDLKYVYMATLIRKVR